MSESKNPDDDLAVRANLNLDAVGEAVKVLKAPWPASPPRSGTHLLTIKTSSDLHHVLWFSTEAERDAFVQDMDGLAVLIRADGYDLTG